MCCVSLFDDGLVRYRQEFAALGDDLHHVVRAVAVSRARQGDLDQDAVGGA